MWSVSIGFKLLFFSIPSMSALGNFRLEFIRHRKLQSALRFLCLDHIHFLVLKARLCHLDFVVIFSSHLLFHSELWDMFCCWDGIGEWVKVLEAVLMGLVYREWFPLCLEIEVDEAGWSRLYHSLVKCIHSAELKRVNLMVVQRLFHSFSLGLIQRSESFTNPGSILLISLREVFFVLPYFVKFLGATIGEPRTHLLWSLSLLKEQTFDISVTKREWQ